ncbi:MAG: hypothetical protein RIR00_298, partial [Pseudomonadota bacterium]
MRGVDFREFAANKGLLGVRLFPA